MKESNVQKHLEMLGLKVKDKVTGMEGVVTSVSFELYGCIQTIVQPFVNEDDGKLENSTWFDVTRLEVLDENPVMDLPEFDKGYISEGKKGCAMNKPVR